MQRQMSSKRSLLAVIALSSIVTVCCAQEKPNAPLPAVASSIAAPSATMLSPEASGTAEAADPEQNAAWQNPTSPSATPSAPASAPQGAPPSTNSSQTPAQPAQSAQSGKTQTADQATSKDRLFYTLPNFLTLENAGEVPPMSAGEKFKVVTRSSFDPAQFAWYGLLSGISQAENSEPGYGQGAQGYAKRYAAALGDGVIEGYMVGAAMPALFRQDPRYFQSGKGGFWRRTGYAVSRIVITRGDSGNNQFNFSEILGSGLGAGISTYSYHPHADKTLRNTADVWGTQMSYDALAFFVKEFWPDIRRKMHKNKAEQQP
jgi:hypothetical protein